MKLTAPPPLTAPPLLMDALLRLFLSPCDRETVTGDLHEEFLEVKLPRLGPVRARLWYLRQVLSFAPTRAAALVRNGTPLTLLCCFTALSGGWLGTMDILLKQPGYTARLYIPAIIVSQALLTFLALRFRRLVALRITAILGSLAILWLAAGALKATLGGAHLEGYVLLIALALIVQAILTLLTLPTASIPPGKRA